MVDGLHSDMILRDKMKKNDLSKLSIPGFLLLGIGVGMLLGNVAAFTLIGLGLGFLVGYLSMKGGRK
jgi:hypothetical protein